MKFNQSTKKTRFYFQMSSFCMNLGISTIYLSEEIKKIKKKYGRYTLKCMMVARPTQHDIKYSIRNRYYV